VSHEVLENNIEFKIVFLANYSRMEHHVPLSYEQALAMGRTGGRSFPSPVLNGYKPKGGLPARHSDSDEEDWC